MNDDRYRLELTDQATHEMEAAILMPLADFNTRQAGPSLARPLVVLIRDTDGQVIGVLWGRTGYSWLFTQLLVVPENLRGQGLGRQILGMAESEARVRGCHAAWLDTFEFQARGFYERLGYRCFGELADFPPGYTRYFMQKTLQSGLC